MQTNNKMAVAPVGKLIWQMSIPPLISMFLQYSYNLIDSAFVARLSENALTAVSLSFPITTLMNAASIWIGVGVNVLIAGYLGQKKQDEANPQYGAYRNPEDDTGHREHDCSMWFQIAGVVVNFVFDPILIFGIGIFPAMGIRGAAVATVAGYLLSMIWRLLCCWTKSKKCR